ncbi:MAG: acyl--CoA ligase [Rhodospirillales bacterium]|nr:acyl--CoA ligase [Rhodospirillales bacterium]
MRRQQVASAVVPSVAERRQRIEREPLPRNIADLVATASADGGDRLLWDFFESGEKLTYAELKPRVFALAAGLMSQGIRKGTHVAVMLPNRAAFPLTWLAIGSIGAVMVPMNNSYSDREIAYVVGNSEATYVVVDDSCLEAVDRVVAGGQVKATPDRVIVAGDAPAGRVSLEALMQHDAATFQPPDVGHDDLLNIQYTSGTTGFPKGCMLTQRYWISAGKVNAFRDGRTYRHILASTPFYYMDPQWLLLMTVYQRATLHVAFRQSASRFMEWVREYGIEFCLLPRVILKQPAHPDDRNNKIIRSNVYGISKAAHLEVEERFDLCAREAFGMTEIGPSMFMPIEAANMVGSQSCGIPCPFRECRVADEAGNTVPAGTIGELLVRGPGILKGYYNNPEATQKAFHGDWFRTGDLFRMDERGFFYIVGRIKDMIRRSGENIAAQEVEAVLNAFDAVAESAVVPVKDDMRGEELKAVVVWRDGVAGDDRDIESLLEYCRRNLAPFKVPRYVQCQTELPKTPSGKIAKHRIVHEDGPIFDRVQRAQARSASANHV